MEFFLFFINIEQNSIVNIISINKKTSHWASPKSVNIKANNKHLTNAVLCPVAFYLPF